MRKKCPLRIFTARFVCRLFYGSDDFVFLSKGERDANTRTRTISWSSGRRRVIRYLRCFEYWTLRFYCGREVDVSVWVRVPPESHCCYFPQTHGNAWVYIALQSRWMYIISMLKCNLLHFRRTGVSSNFVKCFIEFWQNAPRLYNQAFRYEANSGDISLTGKSFTVSFKGRYRAAGCQSAFDFKQYIIIISIIIIGKLKIEYYGRKAE